MDVLQRGLEVMDSTAMALCMDNALPVIVFDMAVPGNIRRVIWGEAIGTYVGGRKRAPVGTRSVSDSWPMHISKRSNSSMGKCVEATRSEFASIRTGRATPALLDRLHVEAYGQPVPLKQVAGVSTPDSRTLVITAWDKARSATIRKAIEKSDLGLDAQRRRQRRSGSSIPPLNEERRKDLVKVVKKKAEDGKVAVRNVRHKAHDEIKAQLKGSEITEDDNKRMQDRCRSSPTSTSRRSTRWSPPKKKRSWRCERSDDRTRCRKSQARRALRGRRAAALGARSARRWLGCGTLRVLRVRTHRRRPIGRPDRRIRVVRAR